MTPKTMLALALLAAGCAAESESTTEPFTCNVEPEPSECAWQADPCYSPPELEAGKCWMVLADSEAAIQTVGSGPACNSDSLSACWLVNPSDPLSRAWTHVRRAGSDAKPPAIFEVDCDVTC